MTSSPTGPTHVLSAADHVVTVQELGARLVSYEVGGRSVVRDLQRPAFSDFFKGAHGQVLMPWPNRVDGGRYKVDGTTMQLPLTEAGNGNAMHGFVRFLSWTVTAQSSDSITLQLDSLAQPGYPFRFGATVTYSVSEDGLTVEMSAVNTSDGTIPFAMGMHPYITAGSEFVDEDTFEFDASLHYVANNRGIPEGDAATVDGTSFDFRSGAPLKGVVADVAVTGLGRDDRGWAVATLHGAQGSTSLWMDEAFTHAMVFTSDTLSVQDERRRSIAIEPMTAAANAFNNGNGLHRLSPGETFTGVWGVFVH